MIGVALLDAILVSIELDAGDKAAVDVLDVDWAAAMAAVKA